MSAALKQATLAVVLALGMGAFAPTFGQTTSESRVAAIHECSTKAAKHKDYADETAHIATYRSCMTEKGQPY
jgi:hypothetical protein